jgi:hypothetical protein
MLPPSWASVSPLELLDPSLSLNLLFFGHALQLCAALQMCAAGM